MKAGTGRDHRNFESRLTAKEAKVKGQTQITLSLKSEKGSLSSFFPLLQKGFAVKTQAGNSIKNLLCDQFGVDAGYLEDRIQTIFLDGKPVDDAETAIVKSGSTVALSAAMTLRHAGLKVQALVEEDPDLHTYPSVANMLAHGLRFPIFKNTAIKSICGKNRVTGIVLASRSNGHECHVACDTIIVTGRFQPESALIMETGIQVDPLSRGPVVDLGLMTTLPGIYAAGNILRGANMHERRVHDHPQRPRAARASS